MNKSKSNSAWSTQSLESFFWFCSWFFFNHLTVKVFPSIVLFFEIFILLEPAVVKTFFFPQSAPLKSWWCNKRHNKIRDISLYLNIGIPRAISLLTPTHTPQLRNLLMNHDLITSSGIVFKYSEMYMLSFVISYSILHWYFHSLVFSLSFSLHPSFHAVADLCCPVCVPLQMPLGTQWSLYCHPY